MRKWGALNKTLLGTYLGLSLSSNLLGGGLAFTSVVGGVTNSVSLTKPVDNSTNKVYIPAIPSFVNVGGLPYIKITADLSEVHPSNKYHLKYSLPNGMTTNWVEQDKIIKHASLESALIPEPTNGWYTMCYEFVQVK